ncbi:MAG: hypothetical protein V7750_04825 [Sneathiella sp.]
MDVMSLFTIVAITVMADSVLQDEFGVYDDPTVRPSASKQIRNREIYQRHKKTGQLVPISPNNSAGPIRAENSQFNKRPLSRGSTLSRGSRALYPRAPSRFSRPSSKY